MAQFWQQVVSGLASGGIYASLALALLIVLNGATQWIWGGAVRKFPSPFSTRPIHVGSAAFSIQDIGIVGVCLAAVALLTLFFRFTKLGLGLRAAAVNPDESRLVGVRVGWMLALGWGLSAALGAVSGMMVAPVVFLDPNMMQGVLLYAFVAAALLVAFGPSFISSYHALEWSQVAIYFVALIGLNVLTGYSGQVSLGHGAFMAIGGYTSAIL